VPVLAIAAQIPANEIGSGYFQETHPEHLFAQCSHYCEVVLHPEQMPRALEIAMQTAVSRRGVSVITLRGRCRPARGRGEGPRLTAGGSGFLAVVSGSGPPARPVSESGRLRQGAGGPSGRRPPSPRANVAYDPEMRWRSSRRREGQDR
jgi:hypothetical protein